LIIEKPNIPIWSNSKTILFGTAVLISMRQKSVTSHGLVRCVKTSRCRAYCGDLR